MDKFIIKQKIVFIDKTCKDLYNKDSSSEEIANAISLLQEFRGVLVTELIILENTDGLGATWQS